METMDNATKIQAVLNTLNIIKFDGTYDNCNRLLGIHRTLMEVRDSLMAEKAEKKESEKQEAEKNAGEIDAE